MNIKKSLTNIFNSIVGNFAVVGPHDGIEVELMLAGKKPLTWMPVLPDDYKAAARLRRINYHAGAFSVSFRIENGPRLSDAKNG